MQTDGACGLAGGLDVQHQRRHRQQAFGLVRPLHQAQAGHGEQVAEPGVYITMSGSVFRADQVIKDRAKGAFVSIPT